jgi:hypothetical protein
MTHFNNNVTGIYVTEDPASFLDAEGATPTGGTGRTITASLNTGNGIRLLSNHAGNLIQNVLIRENDVSGLVVEGGSKLKVRNCIFDTNASDNVHLIDNGNITSVTNIDLGTLADPGKNEFLSPGDVHICLSTTLDGTSLNAMGNQFGSLDCSIMMPMGKIQHYLTCNGHGGGVAENGVGQRVQGVSLVFVDHCQYNYN